MARCFPFDNNENIDAFTKLKNSTTFWHAFGGAETFYR